MEELSHFEISLKGLKKGIYSYDFLIGPAFFEALPLAGKERGNFKIHIDLDKRSELIDVGFEIEGFLITDCDRCLSQIKLPISTDNQLIFKYEADEDFDDERIVIISPEEHKLDLSPYILEHILLTIPIMRTYDCDKEDEIPCDMGVLERLAEPNEAEHVDNPFQDLLKDFKKEDKN